MQLLNGSHQAHMVMNTQTPYQHPCFAPLFYVGRLKRPLKHTMEHWGGNAHRGDIPSCASKDVGTLS